MSKTSSASPPPAPAPGMGASFRIAFTSWRTGAVTLLAFPSGLPLGVVLITIPYWLQQEGIDIKTIGLVSAAQIPYAFKFLWSPLIDRFAPRWGRKRAWIILGQLLVSATLAAFAAMSGSPSVAVVALLTVFLSFASATQDIAYDAYTVEVLRPTERNLAVGAKTALARAAAFMGRILNTVGPAFGWARAFAVLAVSFLPFMAVTARAPEPDAPPAPPRTLREAVWDPFVGFFRQARALEIAAFLFFYKFADNLAVSLISPFLGQLGYSPVDVGLAQGLISLVAGIAGTFVGGMLCNVMGTGRALWIFGFLQAASNLGYVVVAKAGVVPWVMYAATAVEAGTSGLGTGAFGILLVRLTQRRFSATQYALFSSIFALGRTFAGPPAGAVVDAVGWTTFFYFTVPMAIPGLLLLNRFVPWGAREIPEALDEDAAPPTHGTPVGLRGLVARACVGAATGTLVAYALNVLLLALKRARGEAPFDVLAAASALLHPTRAVDWVDLVGPPVAGVVIGLAVAAFVAARRGVAPAARPT
ncbi:MAG: MFS transporter [Anaeromyxobacter sp.]